MLTPKPEAVVVWGRIEMLVDRAACVPLLERFFDEEGRPGANHDLLRLPQHRLAPRSPRG